MLNWFLSCKRSSPSCEQGPVLFGVFQWSCVWFPKITLGPIHTNAFSKDLRCTVQRAPLFSDAPKLPKMWMLPLMCPFSVFYHFACWNYQLNPQPCHKSPLSLIYKLQHFQNKAFLPVHTKNEGVLKTMSFQVSSFGLVFESLHLLSAFFYCFSMDDRSECTKAYAFLNENALFWTGPYRRGQGKITLVAKIRWNSPGSSCSNAG